MATQSKKPPDKLKKEHSRRKRAVDLHCRAKEMAAITRVSREITSLSSLQVENTKLLEAEARRRREAETLSMAIQALSST